MSKTLLASVLLIGAVTVGGPRGWAQGTSGFQVSSADLAITFTTERSKLTPGTGNEFWLNGASLDGGITLFRGFGAAANFTSDQAANVAPNLSLDKLSLMAGPRYTYEWGGKHQSRVFVETLFGFAHARDGAFPTATGVSNTANSFSLQVGGGWDVAVSKHVAIRVFEADYVRTGLPNNGTNIQDHLRLAFGVVLHIPRH